MRLKLDENLPAELVEDLRALGHDADSVESQGLAGKPDTVIADAARRSDRVLVTLDKGLATSGGSHQGTTAASCYCD
jgi:predicted nuclease of predicted toxin-antitoxin system